MPDDALLARRQAAIQAIAAVLASQTRRSTSPRAARAMGHSPSISVGNATLLCSKKCRATSVAVLHAGWHDRSVNLRGLFRLRRQPVARIDPDPLRSPEDAAELGLMIGMTGNEQTPWNAIAIKNLKDKRLATGADEEAAGSTHVAGKPAGRVAGHPPQ